MIEERLQGLARDDGNRVALRCKDRAVTFAGAAEALRALTERVGSLEGIRAVAILPDGVASYLLHLHFFAGGGTLVPQSPAVTPDRLSAILSRLRPGMVVTSPALLPKYAELDFGCPVLLACEDPKTTEDVSWEWKEAGSEIVTDSESDVRVVLFTSGSTGSPKGVCLGRETIEAAARINVSILSLSRGRRSLATVPLYDYYGLIQIYSHLLAGGELVVGETPIFPASVLRQVERLGVTDLVGVPFGLRQVFRTAAETRDASLSGLKVVTSSSEMLSTDILRLIFEQCPDATVFDVYGLNEAGRASSLAIRRGQEEDRSLGQPSPGVTITAGLSREEPGEILIQGANVMLGYLADVTPEGRLLYEPCDLAHTGDLGFMDGEGKLHLTGRRDDLLNLHGDKIHPLEIESIVLESGGVSDARARVEAAAEPELILEVVTRDSDFDFSALRRLLRERLPFHFVPRRIIPVEAIARTELGSKMVRI